MTRPIWRNLIFTKPNDDSTTTKTHVVPASLQRHLVADLISRGMSEPSERKDVRSTGWDNPGMIHADRPWEDFQLPGLTFSIPCEDVVDALERLKGLKMRTFIATSRGLEHHYFKLHSWGHCVVMKPEHHIMLETQMAARLPKAIETARIFWADKQSPNQVLRQVNAKLANVPIEKVPSTPHPVERYIPKERGQA